MKPEEVVAKATSRRDEWRAAKIHGCFRRKEGMNYGLKTKAPPKRGLAKQIDGHS